MALQRIEKRQVTFSHASVLQFQCEVSPCTIWHLQILTLDPVFLPSLKGRGYTGVERYVKVIHIKYVYKQYTLYNNLLYILCSKLISPKLQLLIFPIHCPQHWILIVGQLCTISAHCINITIPNCRLYLCKYKLLLS